VQTITGDGSATKVLSEAGLKAILDALGAGGGASVTYNLYESVAAAETALGSYTFAAGEIAVFAYTIEAGVTGALVTFGTQAGSGVDSYQLVATIDEIDSAISEHESHAGAHPAASTSVGGFMSSTDKTKLDNIAANANNYTHPTTAGNKHIPSGGAANQVLKYSADGTAVWAALDDNMHGNRGRGSLHSVATTSEAGFMSAADKLKLDELAAPSSAFSLVSADNSTVFPSGEITYSGLMSLFTSGVYHIKLAVTSASVDDTLDLVGNSKLFVHGATKAIGGIEYYAGEVQVFGIDRDTSDNLYLYPLGVGMTNN
jgi:hypothetical protein